MRAWHSFLLAHELSRGRGSCNGGHVKSTMKSCLLNRLTRLTRLLAAAALSVPVGAGATDADADASQAAAHWRQLARIDVEAGYDLLNENHPGAVPESRDPDFVRRLDAARAKGLARSANVASYEGYVATVGEFANLMADGHIWSNPRFVPRGVHWAGIVAARHGSNWIVADEDVSVSGIQLLGARILECDGISADALARDVLRFRTDTEVQAQLVMRGAWLLVDEGNPFIERPKSCVFERGSERIDAIFHWTAVARDVLLGKHWDHPYGPA